MMCAGGDYVPSTMVANVCVFGPIHYTLHTSHIELNCRLTSIWCIQNRFFSATIIISLCHTLAVPLDEINKHPISLSTHTHTILLEHTHKRQEIVFEITVSTEMEQANGRERRTDAARSSVYGFLIMMHAPFSWMRAPVLPQRQFRCRV